MTHPSVNAAKKMLSRKVPKSAMEKLKLLDADELRRREERLRLKCESELDKIDWDLMKKHFCSPEGRESYEKLCRQIRYAIVYTVPSLVHKKKPDPYLQFYYGEFLGPSFMELMLSKWTNGKKLLQKGLPIMASLGLGVAVGLAALNLVWNEKEKEE